MLPDDPKRRFIVALKKLCVISVGVFLTTVMPAAATNAPQGNPVLQVTEPSEGAIVNPGQSLNVRVTSPTPAIFPEVAVMGDAIGFAGTISGLPGELSVQIPKDIKLGRHSISVVGRPQSAKEPIVAATEIDVERPDLPASMSASFSGLQFDSPGEQVHLDVFAGFFDRATSPIKTVTYDVTESSHISYSSANTEVATVDSSGQVTAVAPGAGEIRVTYALGEIRVSIGVPVHLRNPDEEETGANKFLFSIAPGLQKVEPGGSASFKVTVSSFSNFSGEIEFTPHGLPEGATANFTPNSVHVPESTTLTIWTSASTPSDTYPIFISGRSGKLNPTASVLLIVTANGKR